MPEPAPNAVARQIVEYVAQLQLQNQLELMRSQTEAINKALASASIATATEIAAAAQARAAAAQAKAKDSMLKAIQHLQAEEKRIKEMAAAQQSTLPQVSVPAAAKIASRLVFIVCMFALLLWAVTGFSMIHPAIAGLTMIGCVGFYLMGRMAERGHS
jgi:hypothetical protein